MKENRHVQLSISDSKEVNHGLYLEKVSLFVVNLLLMKILLYVGKLFLMNGFQKVWDPGNSDSTFRAAARKPQGEQKREKT